ncbi:Uncharacterised protein [Mycobacteroides abscessus subsp. abscessus]|nr:Uncharacterised protein [Mycobacteroides abscessus subsp. abscessus]SKV52696.1 Uncharacterised protein [Mycobacteroides abscessus subsp. abscessus]
MLGIRSSPSTRVRISTSSTDTLGSTSRLCTVVSSSWWAMPRPADSAPCGSRSTSSTRRPYPASAAPRLMVDVVFPTPPFWLHIAITLAGP